MPTNSLKISDTSEKEFFELIFFRVTEKHDKNTAVEIEVVFRTL